MALMALMALMAVMAIMAVVAINGMEEKFQKLRVWQEAKKLVLLIYQHTKNFPDEERFGLTNQMRRAAISVAANIAEGSKKNSVKDRRHFHAIAEASLEELKSHALIAFELEMLDEEDKETVLQQARFVGLLLHRFTQSL